MIANEAHEDATVIWGVAFDPEMEDAMKITIIATGFENENETLEMPNAASQSVRAPEIKVSADKEEKAEKAAEASDPTADISDDELDELLGIVNVKNKEHKLDVTEPSSGLKRYF